MKEGIINREECVCVHVVRFLSFPLLNHSAAHPSQHHISLSLQSTIILFENDLLIQILYSFEITLFTLQIIQSHHISSKFLLCDTKSHHIMSHQLNLISCCYMTLVTLLDVRFQLTDRQQSSIDQNRIAFIRVRLSLIISFSLLCSSFFLLNFGLSFIWLNWLNSLFLILLRIASNHSASLY